MRPYLTVNYCIFPEFFGTREKAFRKFVKVFEIILLPKFFGPGSKFWIFYLQSFAATSRRGTNLTEIGYILNKMAL